MLLRATQTGVEALAPAKLNLTLEIAGRRPDGFHELRTVLVGLRLFDRLRIEPDPPEGEPGDATAFATAGGAAGSLRLTRLAGGGTDVRADASNLVVRALDRLAEAASRPLRAAITLVKAIPSRAGLGGGSSDAAATLVAGERAWGLRLGAEKLLALAAELGSDVPFFVSLLLGQGRAALGEGRGERLRPLATRGRAACVVVRPPRGLSTPEVYAHCRPEDYQVQTAAADVAEALRRGAWQTVGRRLTNALEPAARRVAPWLKDLPEQVRGLPHWGGQLSGSGSAYFFLCPTGGVARRVAAAVHARRAGRVLVTSTY